MILWQKNSITKIYHAYDKPLSKDDFIKSLCGRGMSRPGQFGNMPSKSECCLLCYAREKKAPRTSGDIDL